MTTKAVKSPGRKKARSRAKTDEFAESTEKRKPLRPAECRGHLRRELASSFPAIVRGFVKQAESGSVQHLKLTTELLEKLAKPRTRKGSAQRMLEKLGRMSPEGSGDAEVPSPDSGRQDDSDSESSSLSKGEGWVR